MSELRWIIGLIGLGVIAALYLWGRRRASTRKARGDDGRVEPRLDGGAPRNSEISERLTTPADRRWVEFPETEVRREPSGKGVGTSSVSAERKAPEAGDATPQKIVVLHVRAAGGRDFTGQELLDALTGEGLEYGQYGAFHQLDEKGRSIFAIANMMEPGSFPKDDMASFSTVGITAFMVLPGPAGVDGLARMVACCRRLASILGGEVLDESRSTLTNQRATHMKEEVIEFLRQARLDPSGIGPGMA